MGPKLVDPEFPATIKKAKGVGQQQQQQEQEQQQELQHEQQQGQQRQQRQQWQQEQLEQDKVVVTSGRQPCHQKHIKQIER